jgi:outer membrane protein assembly factor BamB
MAEHSDRDPRRREALDRYWDAIVDGYLAEPDGDLDARQAAIVRRVHALAGQPMPEPVRAEHLWRNLMSGYAPTVPLRLAPSIPRPANGHRGRPLAAPRPIARPGRVSNGISILSTVALVAVVLAMIFFIYHNQNNATVPLAQETPTAVPATPSAGWPTMLANNHRTAVTDAPGPVGTFSSLWTFRAPGGLDNVIVAGDAAFLQSEDGTLYCLDRMTGHQRWALNTGGPNGNGNVMSYPAVADGIVYAGSRTGDVWAIDAATGGTKWRIHLSADPVEASMLVQDGIVYTGTGGGLFVALNTTDGSERWRFNDGQDFVNTFPALDNGVIYVGGPQSVRAIGATTGKLVWESRTDGQVRGAEVDNGVVYAPTAPGSVYALNEADGHQLWTQTFTDAAPGLSVAVSGGMVVAGFGTGGMMGLDAASGKVVWQTPDSGGVTTASKVSIANGIAYAYFGPRKGILAVDAKTGQELGFGATEEIRMPSSIVDGVLYAGSGVGIAYAFTSTDATITPQQQIATPAVATAPAATTTPAAVPTVAAQQLPVKFIASFSGWDPAQHPSGVLSLAPDGKIWVGLGRGTYDIFDLDGNLLEEWGTPGNEPGQLDFYNGIANFANITFRSDGSFYVQDLNGVQYFDKDRHFVKLIDPAGGGSRLLTVAPDGTLWVTQANPSRIDHFDADGNKIGEFDGKGTKTGILHAPSGLALDVQGRLYVPEQDGNRVRIFDQNSNELGMLGQDDPGFPGIYRPFQVTIDAAGMIYVCDRDRVDVFDPQWHYLGWFGGAGTGDGQFQTADGVIVNRTKTIFVIDYGNNRIQKFAITGPWPTAASAATPSP